MLIWTKMLQNAVTMKTATQTECLLSTLFKSLTYLLLVRILKRNSQNSILILLVWVKEKLKWIISLWIKNSVHNCQAYKTVSSLKSNPRELCSWKWNRAFEKAKRYQDEGITTVFFFQKWINKKYLLCSG